MTNGAVLGLAGAALAAMTLAHYASTVRAVRVALRPRAHQTLFGLAMALALLALARGAGWVGGAAALATLGVGTIFLLLTTLSGLPPGRLAVRVGAPAPDFVAAASDGAPFQLAALRGRRVLLKFFRGHW
jgi:hypothetical protein